MGFKHILTIGTLMFCCIIEMSGVAFQLNNQEVIFMPSDSFSSVKLYRFMTSDYFQTIGDRLFLSLSWVSAFGMLVAYFTVRK